MHDRLGDINTGLAKAVRACGSRHALADKLGINHSAVGKWRQVPEQRLAAVAAATGIAAEDLRPDLATRLRLDRQQQALNRARERFSLAGATAKVKSPSQPRATAVDLFDLGLIVAGQQFAARSRGFTTSQVMGADMHGQAVKSARAYGFALAMVVGRVSSTLIANVLGTSRQNVENASERYLRARDGDEAADWDDPAFDPSMEGHVIERGRRRPRKSPSEQLWAAEAEFLNWLEGNL